MSALQRLDSSALFRSAEGFRGLWFYVTVRIKIDELLENGKSSIFPLCISEALNTPSSCLDGGTCYSRGECTLRHLSLKKASAQGFLKMGLKTTFQVVSILKVKPSSILI